MVRGSMAKITKSLANQIVRAYENISEIHEQYPNVTANESVSDDAMYAHVECFRGINIYINVDGMKVRINRVNCCKLDDNELSIEGSEGYITIEIDE